MRLVLQRVQQAAVYIQNQEFSRIGVGLLVLLGIEESDSKDDIDWLVSKLLRLRIFDDMNGVMNISVEDANGEIMVVSQFTLMASTKKGNRPSYIRAARPEIAIPLYQEFVKTLQSSCSLKITTGEFGANMQVNLVNDGPVTIIIDSKNRE